MENATPYASTYRAATAMDVAAYILKQCGPITAMKLQKLVYYSQAWSLVWDERPLFHDKIKAWVNGPVVGTLYHAHRGRLTLTPGDVAGNIEALDPKARETIDAVLKFYGHRTAQWLSDLTHSEAPWTNARKGMKTGDRGNVEITQAAIHEYYSSLK